MFYVEGLVPLCDVASAVKSRLLLEALHARRGVKEPLDWEAFDADIDSRSHAEIWLICKQAKRVAVLLGNGRVVDASRDLVRAPGVNAKSNRHVDVFVGNVGSTDFWDFDEDPQGAVRQLMLVRDYGPFANLPVLLNEECLERAKKGPMPEEEAAENANGGRSEAAVANDIIAAWDQGMRLPKAEFKDLFAKSMGGKAYDRAWARARESRDGLGKAGRRPTRG